MNTLNIETIKNLYWRLETIRKKHRRAHLAAEIYYIAHIALGLFVLLLKLDDFGVIASFFNQPPTWLGVLFPLLTIGKFDISYISVIATITCIFAVPAVISTLLYFLLSICLFKRSSFRKNPFKNEKNNDIFEKCYKMGLQEGDAVRALKNRIHKVVWIQVLCFAALFSLLVIWGGIQGTIKPEEVGMGILCAVFVGPAYSIVLYVLRWLEYRLFIPMDKIFTAVYRKRVKKPLDTIKDNCLYQSYVNGETAKYHAKLEKERREKEKQERIRRDFERRMQDPENRPRVFVEDIMRRMAEEEARKNAPSNPDPTGIRDGVHVDGTGI